MCYICGGSCLHVFCEGVMTSIIVLLEMRVTFIKCVCMVNFTVCVRAFVYS